MAGGRWFMNMFGNNTSNEEKRKIGILSFPSLLVLLPKHVILKGEEVDDIFGGVWKLRFPQA